MTLLHRIAVVCFGAAMVTLATAPAASADLVPPADGYYTYNEPGKPTGQWDLAAVCMQANGTRAQQDYTDTTIQTQGCIVNVNLTTAKNATPDENLLNTSGRARLTNGLWTFTQPFLSGMVCPDGSKAPLIETFAFDGATLAGTRTITWNAVCGMQPGMTKTNFSLSFNGPLQPPVVDRFPDNCNYLAGRPSICS